MPNVLLPPKIDKLLPPADSGPKAPSKRPTTSFDDALDKARPKPKPADDAPPAKKTGHAGGGKKAAAKPAAQVTVPVKGKVLNADEAETETAENAAEESEHAETNDQQPQPTVSDLPVPGKAKPPTDATKTPAQKAEKPKDGPDPQLVVEAVNPDGKQQQQPKNPEQDQDAADDAPVKVKSTGATAPTAGPKVVAKPAAKKATQTTAAKNVASTTDTTASAAEDDGDASAESSDDDASTPISEKTATVAKKTTAQQQPQPAQDQTGDAPALGAGPKAPQAPVAANSQNTTADTDDSAGVQSVSATDDTADSSPVPDPSAAPAQHLDPVGNFAALLEAKPATATTAAGARPAAPPPPAPPAPPEVRFADTNHPQIVSSIRGQLLPDGGTMHIRLDPPELGALQVSVHMQDGVMSASFQTSNDDATKLLSHSLAQLKHVLESQGVTVDKLHVSQAPRDEKGGNEDNGKQQQSASDNSSARQEQQRREILQRMWDKLTNGADPLDMVA